MEHLTFRPLRSGLIQFKDAADEAAHARDCRFNVQLGLAMHLAALPHQQANSLWHGCKKKMGDAFMAEVGALGKRLREQQAAAA